MIKNNTEILAVCPLILNTVNMKGSSYRTFSFDRYYGVAPATKPGISHKQRMKIERMIYDHIGDLAKKLDVQCCLMKISPLAKVFFHSIPHNSLMRFGFLDVSLNTQVIDLAKPEDQLLAEMRESHRYDIRRGMKHFKVIVYDAESITQEIFDQYRRLHHKTSGRVTRPLSTFSMMHRWILEGKAVLCGAVYMGKYVGFALVNVYREGAFYSSASDDPEEVVPVPASHAIQWGIIRWLKGHDIRYYETGLQQWGDQLYDTPSPKDLSIASFKRGFGGITVPFFAGEKFFSRDYFSRVTKDRTEKYLNTLG